MSMNSETTKRALVVAVAGAVALGAATPAWAAPVSSATIAVKAAAPSAVSDIRHRNRAYHNNGAGAAAVLGILGAAGAVAAGSAYRRNSYGDQGYYQQGYGSPYGGYARQQGYYGGPYKGYTQGPASYGYYNNY
jgi:hypothetical protein